MKNFISLSLLATLALTQSGCGKSVKNTTASSTDSVQYFDQIQDLKEAINNQKVICGEADQKCPGAVAKLAMWGKEDNEYYLGTCSGTLVMDEYIITNSHCIPDEIKKAHADCSKQMVVLFPETNNQKAEKAACRDIIQVFDHKKGEPDIAVILIAKKVFRGESVVVKPGFVENEIVHAYTQNPNKIEKGLGIITKKTCQLSTDNLFLLSNDPNAPRAILHGEDCDVISGNSGSGLFNKNNEYIGAVNAAYEMTPLKNYFDRQLIRNKFSGFMGMVQNIGCLNSIYQDLGSNCGPRKQSVEQLNQYVERELKRSGFKSNERENLQVTVVEGMKLAFQKYGYVPSYQNLTSLIDLWSRIGLETKSKERFVKEL